MVTTQVSIEQYLCSDYEPDADYVDGKIEERPAGEDDHSSCNWRFKNGFGT